MITIVPVKGKEPINPKTMDKLPQKGIVLDKLDRYWADRLNDGDIEIVDVKTKKEQGAK